MKQERDESYSHVLKYTGVFGGVQGLNVVIGLVRNKFVAVLLGPGGMGLVSLFNTTVQLISQATHWVYRSVQCDIFRNTTMLARRRRLHTT